jgi:hypothetical protein
MINDARGIADLMHVNKSRRVWGEVTAGTETGSSPDGARRIAIATDRPGEHTIHGLLRQEGIGLTDRRTAFEAAPRVLEGNRLLHAAALSG